jgi:hypothetical protein
MISVGCQKGASNLPFLAKFSQLVFEQLHQHVNFFRWTFKVVHAEGKNGHSLDVKFQAHLKDLTEIEHQFFLR